MKIEYYEGSSGKWSWQVCDDVHGEVVAHGAKSYDTREEVEAAVGRVAATLQVKHTVVARPLDGPEEEVSAV